MKTKHLLLSIFTFILLTGCNQNSSKPNVSTYKPNYSTPPFIIDDHVHARANADWEKSFLEVYTRHNAMACCFYDANDWAVGITFAKAHPERVIPYASVNLDSPTVLEDIQKAYAMGFKGLGELFAKGRWSYNDPRYDSIWALAAKLGMPIAPHTGNLATGLMDHLRPGSLADITSMNPKLIVHAAHFGNPWYEEAAEAARRNSNLYFDLSGSSLIKKENDPGYWAQWLWWTDYLGKAHMPGNAVPAWEKIVFGTDEGPDQFEENIRRFNKVLDACNVPDSTRAKCYGLTMARLLGIKVPVK